ncbi:MAG TPA: N-acetylmuramoyl-L-alanine amidase [Limnochordia bacterium]|nr:N-acetylmuramoyl-L-alanine amidase [Limnochordia bacterium]
MRVHSRTMIGLWAALIVLACGVGCVADGVKLIIDGRSVALSRSPILSGGELMVPIDIAKALQATATETAPGRVELQSDNHRLRLTLGSLVAYVDGAQVSLGAAAMRDERALWIPIGVLARTFGYEVHYLTQPVAISLEHRAQPVRVVPDQPRPAVTAKPAGAPAPVAGPATTEAVRDPADLNRQGAAFPAPSVPTPKSEQVQEAAPAAPARPEVTVRAGALGAAWPVLGASFPSVDELMAGRPGGGAAAETPAGSSAPATPDTSSAPPSVTPAQVAAASDELPALDGIAVSQVGPVSVVRFHSSGLLPMSVVALNDPARIQFDFYGVGPGTKLAPAADGDVTQFEVKSLSTAVTRVVAQLASPRIPVRIESDDLHQASVALLRPLPALDLQLGGSTITLGGLPAEVEPQLEPQGGGLDILLPGVGATRPPADRAPADGPVSALQVRNTAQGLLIHVELRLPAGFKTARAGARWTLQLGAPDLKGRVILIDPGHGGLDTGARGRIGGRMLNEKDLNLSVSRLLIGMLTAAGAQVETTRRDDNLPIFEPQWKQVADAHDDACREQAIIECDLDLRAFIDSRVQPDMIVSIHTNSAPGSSASGIEVYYAGRMDPTGVDAAARRSLIQESDALAAQIDAGLVEATGLPNRGVKTGYMWVLHKNPNPGVLVEMGFISNAHDIALLADEAFQLKVATGIFRGIVGYYNRTADHSAGAARPGSENRSAPDGPGGGA